MSVFPVISEIFEMALHEQLCHYFTVNGFFSTQQYGFIKNASTELATLELNDRLLNQWNASKSFKIYTLICLRHLTVLAINIILEKLIYYRVNDIHVYPYNCRKVISPIENNMYILMLYSEYFIIGLLSRYLVVKAALELYTKQNMQVGYRLKVKNITNISV